MLANILHRIDTVDTNAPAKLNLIASENRMTPLARSFLSTDAASRYSFGGEGGAKAFPGGNTWVGIQTEGESALRRLGSAAHCNLRPLSGLHAMTVAILALTEPGDWILSLSPEDGGHYATGGLSRRLGRRQTEFRLLPDGKVDEESLVRVIEQTKPTLIYVDQCHGLIPLDQGRIVEIARAVLPATLVHADVSHGLGLVFGGVLPNPLQVGCDSYGGSTHKTFPGPQKGVLLTNRQDLAERFAAAQFDAISNHHLNVSVALSIALMEFDEFGGREYARRVNPNALSFAESLAKTGISPVRMGGQFSQWHQLWVADEELPRGAAAAAQALGDVGIMVNLLPDLPHIRPCGLRLGFSEVTHLGLTLGEVGELAQIVAQTVHAGTADLRLQRRVREMVADAPRPYDFVDRRGGEGVEQHLIMPWRDGAALSVAGTVVRGTGSYVEDMGGRRYLSATSGALNAILGFGREDVAALANRQMVTMPSNDATAGLNLPARRLAAQLAEIAGHGLSRTLFCNSGSEATEAAIKVARSVARKLGRLSASKVICFDGAYHGCTAGALSLAGFPFPREGFDSLGNQMAFRWPFPSQVEDLAPLCAELETHLRDEATAIILEPIQGIGGFRPFSMEVLSELRRICDAYGLLLIFDEVFSGIGRTGRAFAFQHYNVAPDVLLSSKGITAGYAPLSAVTMTEATYAACLSGDVYNVMRHGHTMSANATACAVGSAVLDRLRAERLIENAQQQGYFIANALSTGLGRPQVSVRGLGLMIGVVLEDQDIADRVVAKCRQDGVLIRAQNGVCQLSPPLTIGPAAAERLVKVVLDAVHNVVPAHQTERVK
jgi:adenosylmethionine-8-amino-7-oxononanoate aminotransferase/glycine/serine hydroxymethyltransferase